MGGRHGRARAGPGLTAAARGVRIQRRRNEWGGRTSGRASLAPSRRRLRPDTPGRCARPGRAKGRGVARREDKAQAPQGHRGPGGASSTGTSIRPEALLPGRGAQRATRAGERRPRARQPPRGACASGRPRSRGGSEGRARAGPAKGRGAAGRRGLALRLGGGGLDGVWCLFVVVAVVLNVWEHGDVLAQ